MKDKPQPPQIEKFEYIKQCNCDAPSTVNGITIIPELDRVRFEYNQKCPKCTKCKKAWKALHCER